MMEHFGIYKYEIFCHGLYAFGYRIFEDKKLMKIVKSESDCYFDTAQEARFAVIGHITLLENGELKND